jgi:hypothetical protein
MQALVDMMKVNISIHSICLPDYFNRHELLRGSVIPYLETNRLRPCVRDIQKTRPMAYRAKVLGRALLAARTDANSLWMLLSGNPEVAFPSTTANLPVPGLPADTVNVASAASVTAPAAANAPPAAPPKRKARP